VENKSIEIRGVVVSETLKAKQLTEEFKKTREGKRVLY